MHLLSVLFGVVYRLGESLVQIFLIMQLVLQLPSMLFNISMLENLGQLRRTIQKCSFEKMEPQHIQQGKQWFC